MSQTVLWRYQTPLRGSDLAQVNANVLYPGIYSGLAVSIVSGANVSIAAGTMLIFDSASYNTAAAKMVKIALNDAVTLACNTVTKPKFVVARFTWSDALGVEAQFLNVDAPAAYDLILAAIEWTDTSVTRVDTDSATYGFQKGFDKLVNNLRPHPDFTQVRKVLIEPGRFVYGRSSVSVAAQQSVTHDASAHVDGRYDVVGINSSGQVVVVKGTEGGTQPSLGAFLPIYAVHVRNGVSVILGSDLLDLRPFLTFSGVMGDDNVVLDLTGLANLTASGVTGTLASLVSFLNTALYDGNTVDAKTLKGKGVLDAAAGISADDTKVPTALAVKEYADDSISSALSSALSGAVFEGSAGYIALLNKVNHLLSKDVGKVAWFVSDPGAGWLRANGQIISTPGGPGTANALFATLVSRLRAVANNDVTHPYYHSDSRAAKVPNLVDRYIRDDGSSDVLSGRLGSGSVALHTHGEGTLNSSVVSLAHVHSINHSHQVAPVTLENMTLSGKVNLRHKHLINLGTHDHELPDLNHSHVVKGKQSTVGEDNLTFESRGDSKSQNTMESNPARDGNNALKKVAGKLLTGETAETGSEETPVTVSIVQAGRAKAHTTDQFTGSTGSADPGSHSHEVTIPENPGGTGTNEVNHVKLRAYIYYGYPSA